jgi:dihydrodipicolinate synthase/N-acetylneuraminate lyase
MTGAPQEGIIVAVWSPTDEEGRPLTQDLASNLQFIRSKGVQGVMPLGSTGEFLYLDPAQRKRLLGEVLEQAQGLATVANISDVNPRVVADLGRFAYAAGANAVTVLPPYFYPMAQADLVEFFVQASAAAKLPLFLYNFPERTGNRISLETIAAVADRVGLAGVKQSGGEFTYHEALVQLGHEKGFVVFTGTDTRIVEAMGWGVAGVVSVYNGVKGHDLESATLAGARLRILGTLMDGLEFPLNVRATVEARGLAIGAAKSVVSQSTQARYRQLVQELKILFKKWDLI